MNSAKIVQVQIPQGVTAGSQLHVQIEDGRLFTIIVPEGMHPGDMLAVEIHEDAVGGETIVIPAEDVEVMPDKSKNPNRMALGAAAVGACIGTLLVGPITGVVVAGAALYATTRDDKIGDAARTTGTAAANTYDSVAEAARKHKVTEKVSAAAKVTYERAKEIDQEYKVTESIGKAGREVANEAKKINEKYDITGHAGRALISGATATSNTISKLMSSSKSSSSSTDSKHIG